MHIPALILFFTVMLSAAEIKWVDSYDEAVTLAKKEKKSVFALITSETCRWCRKMEATTLKEPSVVDAIDKDFVAVHLTRDKDKYPKYLKAKMVPMSYFLRTNGRVVHSVPGYWTKEGYLSIIGDAVRKINRKRRPR